MYDARDLTTHGVVVGMTGSRQDRPVHQPPRRGRHRRHPLHHHRPQGRPDQPAAAVPRPRPRATSSRGSTRGRRPPEGLSRRRSTPSSSPAAGARGWRRRPDGRSASPGCKASSEWRIYTPGSEAGLPLSILQHLRRPEGQAAARGADAEDRRHRHRPARPDRHRRRPGAVARAHPHRAAAAARLDRRPRPRPAAADPADPEAADPHRRRLQPGDVLPREGPPQVRVALNNVLAAPSFSTWTTGEPLDLATHALPRRQAATADLLRRPSRRHAAHVLHRRCCWKRC